MVGSSDGETLHLLRWDGKRAFTAREIKYGGLVYRPPELHPTLRRAIRLPKGIAEYGEAAALFGQIAAQVERYIGLSGIDSKLAAAWLFTTWFSDRLPSPPPLIVSGPDPALANKLFSFFGCCCRRGLRLGEITRSAFGSLPMELRPTLMIMQPDLPRRMWSLCNSSNYRGTVVPGRSGAVVDLACPKAIFTEMDEVESSYPAMHLSLPPDCSGEPLDEIEENRIADSVQPQMLKYRVDRLRQNYDVRCADGREKSRTELTRNLMLCLPDEPELQPCLSSILEPEESDSLDRESHEFKSAIIEVLWTKMAAPISEIGVAQLAGLTNALLRSRESTLEYSPEEIGWKLKKIGIPRRKRPHCMVVRFTREVRRRVHQMARALGLNLPRHANSCTDCVPAQPVDR